MFALKRLPKFRPVCIQCPYVNIVNPVGYIECTNLDIGEVCCRLSLLAGNKKNMANIVGDDYRLIYIPIVKNVKIDKNENYEFE